MCLRTGFGGEYPEIHFLATHFEFGPGGRVGRQPADEVVDLLYGPVPVDPAGLFVDFGSRP